MVEHLFPGGRGRLRRVSLRPVRDESGPRASGRLPTRPSRSPRSEEEEREELGVEIEVTPAGKSTRKLSLLSGGEKSLVALAFVFAVFLARPCPFYILDEVEAALDDANIDRFLQLDPPLLRPRPVRHRHPPETDDGRRRRALRRQHGRRRRDQGRLPAPAARSRRGRVRIEGEAARRLGVACRSPRPAEPAVADAPSATVSPWRRPGRRSSTSARAARGGRDGRGERRGAPRRLPPPAGEPLEEPPGADRGDLGQPLRPHRRRDLGAARGGADPRRRRGPDHGRGGRAARARGRVRRGRRWTASRSATA